MNGPYVFNGTGVLQTIQIRRERATTVLLAVRDIRLLYGLALAGSFVALFESLLRTLSKEISELAKLTCACLYTGA